MTPAPLGPPREHPTVVVVEEGMREGMQIESAEIPVAEKVRLLDALSATGLQHIVTGSFVSPRWVPQMVDVEELLRSFHPVDGVTYTALALNAKGVERRSEFVPPLSDWDGVGRSMLHLCDVFLQRNTARTLEQELAALPAVVETAVARGATSATVAVNAAWGSNWVGPFSEDDRCAAVERQIAAWEAAGVPVTGLYLGDPMSWNTPSAVESMIRTSLQRWPAIDTFHLHLHDGRGSALVSAYVALRALDARHTLIIDASIGGMGGCPYCGNGRATKMIPTEDLVDLLEEEGVATGIDLDALIEAAAVAEEVVRHELYGKISKVGARPRGDRLYAMDMPLVETIEQAQHVRLGPSVYDGCPSPWKAPITSEQRDRAEKEQS